MREFLFLLSLVVLSLLILSYVLSCDSGMVSKWIYDREPVEAVRFESALSELKQQLTGTL